MKTMKTILTLLLTTVCLCARADTNTIEIFQRGMLKVAESYYKLGYRQSQSDTMDYLATNKLQHVKEMPINAMPTLAWDELVKQNPELAAMAAGKAMPVEKPKQWHTNVMIGTIATNDLTSWLESPMTIPIHNYHANGWETESLWNSYRYTDPKIQIGLKPDGAVIWRKRPEAQQ